MGLRAPRTNIGQAPQPTVQVLPVPASVGGVNALDALMRMPPEDCIYTYNLMPSVRGLQLRKGYREWANGAGTGEVRTILNYESQTGTSSSNRLWAVTNEGIYNVTTFGETTPTKDVTFSTTTDDAGYGVKCEFTSDAADHYLFYADAQNGLHQYEEGVGWSVPTGGTGAGEWYYTNSSGVDTAFPIADIVFVTVFKQRIWVITSSSDDAWYLPPASIAGKLEKFTFGAKMAHGGDLMGVWTWSVDGGSGVDDMLVGIGRGGDVLVYQGSDPALGDFSMIGSWFIGRVPNSRRIVAAYGSEMYTLSSYGVTSLRDLLQGAASSDLRASPSAKINSVLRGAVESAIGESEWAINIHPADGFMQIVTPTATNETAIQYCQNLSTRAWGYWEGVPAICAETWTGEYFIGAASGVVYQYQGTLDGTMLDGTTGDPIEYRMLTSFQDLGNHATFKRAGFIRTLAVSSDGELFSTEAVYDYKEATVLRQPAGALTTAGALWDAGVWDTATWDYTADGHSFPKGASGLGRTVAIGMRGSANTRMEVVGWDVMYTTGGLL